MKQQKAIILDANSKPELDKLLKANWFIVSSCPMPASVNINSINISGSPTNPESTNSAVQMSLPTCLVIVENHY